MFLKALTGLTVIGSVIVNRCAHYRNRADTIMTIEKAEAIIRANYTDMKPGVFIEFTADGKIIERKY